MKNFIIFCILVTTLFGCTGHPLDLAYNTSPDQLMIYAWIYTAPVPSNAYDEFIQSCLFIPDIRVWGNGRTVTLTYQDHSRVIKTGFMSEDYIRSVLNGINKLGFFDPNEKDNVNTSATSWHMTINLRSKPVTHFWGYDQEPYHFLQTSIQSNPDLKVFNPDAGYLVAKPAFGYTSAVTAIPTWPENFGFSLADVTKQGRWITNPEIGFIWNVINQNLLNPIISDQGQIYQVGLEIPGISEKNPPFNCWNS
jgi:hypothetical protein